MSTKQNPQISKSASSRTAAADSKNATGSSAQNQDPIERRRLQNRLSQRNHRRKIRDRIAKLQERVIASELRAAASAHYWEPLCPPPASSGQASSYDFERTSLSPGPETPAPINQSYIPSTGVCSSCSNALCQSSLLSLPASISYFDNCPEFDPSTSPSSSLLSSSTPCTPDSNTMCSDGSLYFPSLYPGPISPPSLSDPVNFQIQSSPSNLYYVATESSLPQVIQTLNANPARPRAIVLIPQDTTLPGSPNTNPSDPLAGLGQMNNLPNMCLCQVGSIPGAGTGPYGPICPLHKPQWLSDYQAMII